MDISIERQHFLNKIKSFALAYKASILLCILFLIIILFQQQPIHITFLSLISSLSLFFFIFLIAQIKFGWVRYILGSLIAAIITLDFVCASVYNSRATVNILGSIFETSVGEAVGMLGDIIIPLVIIILITFTLTLGAVFEFRKVKFSIFKSFVAYSIFFIIISISSMLNSARERAIEKESKELFDFQDLQWHIRKYPSHTLTHLYSKPMSIIYADILGTAYYLREKGNYKDYFNHQRTLKDGMVLTNDSTIADIEKIFFVIGESASSQHMSLYGYDVQTTPNMDRLFADSTSSTKLYYYPAITSILLTREAVPQMLSAKNILPEHNDLVKYKNLIELANETDYETLWISNQKRLGPYDGYIPIIATSATHTVHNIQTHEGKTMYYDDNELIPLINKYYKKNEKQVFFLHLEGSHRAFDMRYDDEDKLAISKETKSVHYDRTIHHTDRFLQNVYELMPTNSILIYISDHGENPESISGRFDKELIIPPHHIPFIAISKGVQRDINKVIQSYLAEDVQLINNSNAYYIIAELIGYSVQQDLKGKLKEQSKLIHIFSSNQIVNIDDLSTLIAYGNY